MSTFTVRTRTSRRGEWTQTERILAGKLLQSFQTYVRSPACIQAAQMQNKDSRCKVCCRGVYSCNWKFTSNSEGRCAGCWFILVVLVSLLSLCWMYICLVTFNDRDEVNWQGFKQLSLWVNWFMVLVIISAVLTSYCILLLVFALFQVALREPLHLHWLHKLLLCFGALFIVFGVTGISIKWHREWPTVPLSLRATGPFLQFGAVGALTLLSPFIFKGIQEAKAQWSKVLIVAVLLAVSAAIFLCPLYIQTQCPCLTEQLPRKPDFIGHRGAPMLAPENTMMSFNRSVACRVTAFETDVQLSKDRIPFLMHDHHSGFLLRTTNVKEKFPDNITSNSSEFTWEELQSLNAGDWFLKMDPFRSVSKLSEEDKAMARNQTIPSLLQLLRLAKQHNISVMFDLYSPDWDNDTEDVVDTILESGIDPHLVLWLPPAKRQYVKKAAPEFNQVYNDSEMLRNKSGNLNVKYSYDIEEIRKLRKMNVSVNVWVVNEQWLFSLMWCVGVSSVTTNSCHLLKDMEHPDWVMLPQTYTTIWILVDVASVVTMAVFYIIYWKKNTFWHRRGAASQQINLSAMKEQHPFLEKMERSDKTQQL